MKTKTRNEKIRVFKNLNGGANYRFTPLIIDAMSDSRLQSPDLSNVDMFYTGSVSKRLGKVKQGDSLSSTSYQSQTSEDLTVSLTSVGGEMAIAQKITTGAAVSVQSVTVKISCNTTTGGPIGATCRIYTNSGSDPNALVTNGSSSQQIVNDSTTPNTVTFNFSTPPSLSGATVYWFLFVFESAPTDVSYMKATTGAAGNVKTDASFESGSWASLSRDLYYVITSSSTSSVLQGIYDYRYASASTQKILAAAGGALYYHARNATPLTGAWTSLITGLGSGQDTLWSFATLKDYAFSADYGNNVQRVWDGTAAYTIAQGFRATFALADSAAAGTVPPGYYWIMPVTQLDSGGYRAGIPAQIQVGGASNHQIVVSSISMDGTGATNFGFDIPATATKWFMTAVTAASTTAPGLFYKIPTGNCSAGNPAANNTTTFNITATTGLTAANTTIEEYTLPQSYFINQIATPANKYLQQYENMIAMAGNSTYPTRVWFSGVKEPMIIAEPTAGTQVYGTFWDYAEGGDNEVIVGIKSHRGYLFVFKRHSVYVTETTENASAFLNVRRISENIGALSHWCIKSTGDRIVFLSERGPMQIIGTTVTPIPSAAAILNRFEPNDPDRYNLSAMQYTTAGINSTKSQIHWGVSSTSATTRDLTLVYDFENDCFWENSVSANFYSEVTDSSFFPSVWSGDYSAQIFQMDTGTSDNGSAISFSFSTPNLKFASPFNKTQVNYLMVSGEVQSSGTLTASVYIDFSDTAFASFSFNMASSGFKNGIQIPLGYVCDYIRVVFTNAEAATPVKIDAIGFGVQDLGQRM